MEAESQGPSEGPGAAPSAREGGARRRGSQRTHDTRLTQSDSPAGGHRCCRRRKKKNCAQSLAQARCSPAARARAGARAAPGAAHRCFVVHRALGRVCARDGRAVAPRRAAPPLPPPTPHTPPATQHPAQPSPPRRGLATRARRAGARSHQRARPADALTAVSRSRGRAIAGAGAPRTLRARRARSRALRGIRTRSDRTRERGGTPNSITDE